MVDFIKFWWWGIAGGAALLMLIIVIAQSAIQEHKDWDQFKTDHNCKLIKKTDSSNTVGLVAGEVALLHEESKSVWKCDDGVEYTKSY